MRLPLQSVRARLTLWYTLVLSVPLAAFAVTSYVVFSRALYDRTDAFVSDALSVISREVTAERRGLPSVNEAIQRTLLEVRFRELDILVLDQHGALVAMSELNHNPAVAPDKALIAAITALAATATPGAPARPKTMQLNGQPVRLLTRAFAPSEQHFTLGGVYPLRDVIETLARIREMFVIVIPLLILSAALGGWFLARRSLAPVDAAFELQRRFMADASHELRTPTAALRAEADVTLSRPQRSEPEYREAMTVVRDAARRLTRIVDDIFLLARADAGHLVLQRSSLDLEDVVVDAVRAIQAIAADRHVRIDAGELVGARIDGDADLLGRVLLNLLDNAVRFTPADGTVTVRMAAVPGAVEVRVADPGPGIPAEARERVFERFYRVDTARSREERATSSGAGLGLAIARRIAELHGGGLTLEDARAGHTEFRVLLPIATTAQPS